MVIGFTLLALALIGVALWSSQRGEASSVVGDGNAYEAYYGKNRFDPGQSLPCDNCVNVGCIGAGVCSCRCHRDSKKKK